MSMSVDSSSLPLSINSAHMSALIDGNSSLCDIDLATMEKAGAGSVPLLPRQLPKRFSPNTQTFLLLLERMEEFELTMRARAVATAHCHSGFGSAKQTKANNIQKEPSESKASLENTTHRIHYSWETINSKDHLLHILDFREQEFEQIEKKLAALSREPRARSHAEQELKQSLEEIYKRQKWTIFEEVTALEDRIAEFDQKTPSLGPQTSFPLLAPVPRRPVVNHAALMDSFQSMAETLEFPIIRLFPDPAESEKMTYQLDDEPIDCPAPPAERKSSPSVDR